ncbi:MAG TPA: protease pro-enzyme activation domain-containing protein, partial [Candidatus Sulfopaludibacter sp.]|nr:protease pro-enzyme activation domain-containing protein [Candidatus Sulfopaludibacter sp.]
MTLAGHVHPAARPANDRGPVDPAFRLPGVTLLLKRSASQQMELDQLLAEQRDPGSSNFRGWLTPEQFAGRFGASTADVGRLTSWLRSQGFSNVQVARSRTFVTFDATAAQAGSAFGTEIRRYQVNGRMHFANATAPSLPASLAAITAGFLGLHDFRLEPQFRSAPNPQMTFSGGVHEMAPDDFATIYDVAPLYAAGVDGTGQSIAVAGQTDINLSDIQAFRTKFNLSPPNLQQVPVPSRPDPGISSGDLPEASLDIEWAGAVARNASV